MRIDIRFAAPDMAHVDALRCEVLVLTCFADERPLRSIAGLVDWRMCGFLSKRMFDGFITGHAGEQVLIPTQGRIPVDKILLFGLGEQPRFATADGEQQIRRIFDTLADLGLRTAGIVLPGRSTDCLDAKTAMETLVLGSQVAQPPDELVLFENHDAERDMAPIVDRERRRERARHYP